MAFDIEHLNRLSHGTLDDEAAVANIDFHIVGCRLLNAVAVLPDMGETSPDGVLALGLAGTAGDDKCCGVGQESAVEKNRWIGAQESD